MTSTSTIPQSGNKKKKSVPLTTEELKTLKKFHKDFHTDTDFAEAVDVPRITLLRIIHFGTGSENYINKIRQFLQTNAN